MHEFDPPYLLFLGAARDSLAAKMAIACSQWRKDRCLGQIRLPGCNADALVPDLSIEDAVARGARSLVIGVVAPGGRLDETWTRTIVEALDRGLDVVSGMHDRLDSFPAVAEAAQRTGRRLIDLRHTQRRIPIGSGKRRSGKRLLTVGTDCSCGKMFTTLSIENELRSRGIECTFRATGQTGILIAGDGIAIDAVVADFISGAVEMLAPDNSASHWDLIEGQGSLFHPSYAGVSLGLLHGAQPDAIVLCHEPTRKSMRGLPDVELPDLAECLALNLTLARRTNPDVECIGVSVDTSRLEPAFANECLARIERDLELPTVDPSRTGVARLADRLLELEGER